MASDVVVAPDDQEGNEPLKATDFLLGFQHLFAMFGATVLVPLLTGLNASTALVAAGVGTLIFHLTTKMKVPVFLGSSFAFIPAIAVVTGAAGGAVIPENVPLAQGGVIAAGVMYLVFAGLTYLMGADRVRRLFPPIVTGPVIMVIGMSLVSVGINDAFGWPDFSQPLTAGHWENALLAFVTLAVTILFMLREKGFFKLIPILMGLGAGYALSLVLNLMGLYTMDLSAIGAAAWLNVPYSTLDANGVGFFTVPVFDWAVMLAIAPIAIVTFMEHIGDITTNGSVVGKDFLKDPGVHRTLFGDGLAVIFSGFIGGPPETTYSENTGVLATTKNYNPRLLRIAAVMAVILGFFGKFGAVIMSIPGPVKGGVEIILFGMIAAIGVRTLANANLDWSHARNTIIVGLMLAFGIGLTVTGGIVVPFVGDATITLSGLFVTVVVGIIANAIFPEKE